jgi:cell division septation protein DedD
MANRSAVLRTFIVLAFVLHGWGRASAQVSEVSEVRTEAKVFEVDRSRLKDLGIPPRGVSAERLESDFIINISESAAKALASSPGARLLQSFQLTTIGDSPAEFRIASRVTSSQSSTESQRLDVGFDFRLLTRVSLKREIALTLISQVKIRNIENDAAESASPISAEAIRHEVTTAEGATVAAGGFITDADTRQLSRIGTLHESPVLNYLFSSGRDDQPELMVVLTPHLVKVSDVPVSAATPRASAPPVQSPVQTSVLIPLQPKVEPAAKTEPGATRYTVQVGAFVTQAKAEAVAADLNNRYPDVFVHLLETVAPGHPRYRVRVGHFPTVQAAKGMEARLRRDGLDTFVANVN